ncbi:RnfABCDGE type electron transport complex subunit D [Sporanaerobacter acetigenes]|uniref:Ion-translocating oxidoreductase complex subunit D n=1 Tax=Sporanaerobacter acetigenes DSM 13106 TaxID=1123281 RepID=A0A1M5UYB3_9FIRM|nr:RnfABCDGE type electron transport complex subunit D [Sporanaerobacter acetigenes]SHH67884.1 electron transport complex protein RnfD [Sporanaerobacter acetigenes DSM 13106]
MDNTLIASSSPHIRSEETVKRIMLDVVIALLPAVIGSIYFFGFNAFKLILISVISSVVFEALIQKAFKKPVTVDDFSAVVTGILLAFNLPASAPWWLPVVGSAFAIIVVKQFFGGLGQNFMNPALAARAMLLSSWPSLMSTYVAPGPDAATSATPLAIMKYGFSDAGASASVAEAGNALPALKDMFLGNIAGAIGETSALLLLIGAVYLLIRGVISWRIPFAYIGTTVLMLFLFGVEAEYIPYHIFAGGLILGAFYMATDYSSSPVTPWGQIIFGIGAGFLTALIRVKGGYPEGVSYSILLMNVATPLIERFTKPKVFGEVK